MRGTTVCGFYGRSNLGDEAILAGIVDLLAEVRPGEAPLALSADPAQTRSAHGIPASYYRAPGAGRRASVRERASLTRAILRRERFLLGGGDLLRPSPSQDVLSAWLGPLALARSLRRRVGLLGISVGVFDDDASRDRIRRALDGVPFVVVRDANSLNRLHAMDVQCPVHKSPDLALRVFPSRSVPSPARARPKVVVSVRGLADRADAATSSVHDRALTELARTLDELCDDGAAVELVPFRSRAEGYQPVDDDYVVSLDLARRCRNAQDISVRRHVTGVDELRRLLSDADLVIGMRLHSVIMAVGLGVPVIALAYDSKVAGFCAEAGVDDCFDLGDLDASTAGARVRALLSGAQQVTRPSTHSDAGVGMQTAARVLADW